MPFHLLPLPYDKSALEPHMSAKTLEFHHEKHHKAYVDMLNKLVAGTKYENAALETIIEDTYEDKEHAKLFNNAGQVWNHNFFWSCMKAPKEGQDCKPKGNAAQQIEKAFGNLDDFKSQFKEAAVSQFGSGWAWLVMDQGKLKITKTSNAVNPLTAAQKPILTCDVWEHAYYLDYQNRRPDMVDAFLNHLVNWDFVAQNLDMTSTSKAA
ncbi:MAG TPA: superoxide dismutase [Alphaproteobacteria bacterium]|nr:superoxide dismutase [Alphaproteobacteria bacterium]